MSFRSGQARAWVAAAAVSLSSVAMFTAEAQAAPAPAHQAVVAAAASSTVKHRTVSAIKVTGNSSKLTVHWTNPKTKGFKGVSVRVARGKKSPSTRHAGHAVKLGAHKKGKVSTSASVSGLAANTIYSFSIWTEYKGSSGKASWTRPVTFSVRTAAAHGSSGGGSPTPVTGPVNGTNGSNGTNGTNGLAGLAGIVTNGTNGLSGVTATLTDLDTGKVIKTVTSGAGGAYQLPIAGSVLDIYQVCFSDLHAAAGAPAGFLTKCLPPQVGALTDITKSLPASALLPGSGITGLVTGGLLGTDPLSGVLVTATNAASGATFTSHTGSDGSYTLAGLPVGTYNLGFGGTGILDVVTNTLGAVAGLVTAIVGTSAATLTTAPTQNLGALL